MNTFGYFWVSWAKLPRLYWIGHLFNLVDIILPNTYVPLGATVWIRGLTRMRRAYESEIEEVRRHRSTNTGLVWMGHIGFNEPTSSLRQERGIKTLSKSTVEANKRFYQRRVSAPLSHYYWDFGTILESALFLLDGDKAKGKAQAVKKW